MKKITLLVAIAALSVLLGSAVSSAAEDPADEIVAAWRILVEIELQAGNPDEALAYLKRIAALTGTQGDQDRFVAICLRYGRFQTALPVCRERAASERADPLHWYQLAICHDGLGDAKARDAALVQARSIRSALIEYTAAVDFLARSQYDSIMRAALEDYRLCAENSSEYGKTNLRIMCLLVESCLDANDYAGALKTCRAWKPLFKKSPDCVGRADLVEKRCEALGLAAQKKFEQAAAIQRDLHSRGESLYRLEIAAELYRSLRGLGDAQAAQDIFDATVRLNLKAAKLDPENLMARNNVAWFVALCGEPLELGLEHAKAAVAGAPDNPAYLDTLAELLFLRGEYEKAMTAMEKALGEHARASACLWRRYRKIQRALEGKPAS